ncbi:hypothetical protein BESB_003060 [Besnoitia besnoiti]|uniref:Transmembrane protein n=1 Tax=Besnoitia besnoiti TaxID=94643 RepID=A0A2A9MJ16_BESBE|nr:hypothetical protein BESB_003060 [Besnoitia besnoiti]PFH37965.1 hypothetical protein BESB_003060 [Besnoitia besnoiti]
MSFIMDEEARPEPTGLSERESWMATREEIEDARRPYKGENVAQKQIERLRMRVLFMWVFNVVLQVSTIVIAVCSATLTFRGQQSTSWLLALTLVNFLVLALAIGAGAWGMSRKHARLLKQSSSIMVALCMICVFEWCYELLFILVGSRREGKWQKGGKYTSEQIWEYNAWMLGDMVADMLSIGVCFISSHHTWELAKMFEMEDQTQVEKLRRRGSDSAYGTFYEKGGRQGTPPFTTKI